MPETISGSWNLQPRDDRSQDPTGLSSGFLTYRGINAMAERFNGIYKVGAHLPEGTVEGSRRCRVRHPRLRRPVQPPPTERRDHRRQQLRHTGRVRSRLLPSNTGRPRGGHPIVRVVTEPGAIQGQGDDRTDTSHAHPWPRTGHSRRAVGPDRLLWRTRAHVACARLLNYG